MTESAIGMRQTMYSNGRPDEFFELETETQCEHRLTGNGPSFRIANRVATRGVCIWCADTFVEETDTRDHGVQFFRKILPDDGGANTSLLMRKIRAMVRDTHSGIGFI